MPEVSIVMPVWRPNPEWLRAAVQSALTSNVDLELIVVDDGNPTPIRPLLDGITDARMRHLRVAHGGVSHARNAGTAHASGRFIRYIDADDVVEPGSTARLLQLAADGGIAYEDTEFCDEQLRPYKRMSSRLRGDIAVDYLLGRIECMHVSMLFPSWTVQRAGPWDCRLRVCEDFDFVVRCLEHAPAVPGTGIATFYRRHGASVSRSKGAIEIAQAAVRTIVSEFLERHPDLRGGETDRAAWRMVHSDEARTALYLNRPVQAALRAAPLIRLAPREAAGIYLRAAKRAIRLSGEAIARTTVRRNAPPRVPRWPPASP